MVKEVNFNESYLGIEFGSTRIKSVLIDKEHNVLAMGSHIWENSLDNGIWIYPYDEIIRGMQNSYREMKNQVKEKYGVTLTKIGGIGISAMMHGYVALDKNDNLLVPFRTWRNAITGVAAEELSTLFNFNIPERWTVAHLYQAILNKESHIKDIAFLTTLAGLIHYKLTGEKVVGVGEGSGIFPINTNCEYEEKMKNLFNSLLSIKGMPYTFDDIAPKIVKCGDCAGHLTKEGARLLDVEGDLSYGIPFCGAEGDAETGMVATNSIKVKTGNVSAGTSVFTMVVLEKPLSKRHVEIDVVATPDGHPVAMIHCNNCTNEINAYAKLFKEVVESLGLKADMNAIYEMMFDSAIKGDKDCGGITAYNYLSGECITKLNEGRLMLIRSPENEMSLNNLMRAQLFSAVTTLNIGMRILTEEKVSLDSMVGHGGYFKSGDAGATAMALTLNTPITVMQTANEGGAWGMAVLVAYMANKGDLSLPDYLDKKVFINMKSKTIYPNGEDLNGFNKYMERFEKGIVLERKAVEIL